MWLRRHRQCDVKPRRCSRSYACASVATGCCQRANSDHGETPLDAARREKLEETGRATSVRNIWVRWLIRWARNVPKSCISGIWKPTKGRRANWMKDIAKVAWLPLDQALRRLTRNHEHAFLAQVGPMVLAAKMYEATAPTRSGAARSIRIACLLPPRSSWPFARRLVRQTPPLTEWRAAAGPSVPRE